MDLFFTDTPTSLSQCTVTNIQPLSDHNLIHTELTTHTNTDEVETAIRERSLPAQINFRAINDEAYKKELDQVDWKTTLDVPNDKMSSAFTKEACAAAVRINAPRFRDKKNKKAQGKLKQLAEKREKLHKQNEHPAVTNETKQSNLEEIQNLDQEIVDVVRSEREAEEIRVIKNFRKNSRDFYKYIFVILRFGPVWTWLLTMAFALALNLT